MQTKLFQQMTYDEQLQWATAFGEYLNSEWPALKQVAKQKSAEWTVELQHAMERLIKLLMAWPFTQDFCEKAQRYGDYAARAYRMPLYIEKVQQLVAQIGDVALTNAVCASEPEKPKRGRPASEATIARREAERKAAQMQVQMFRPTPDPSLQERGAVTAAADANNTPPSQGGDGGGSMPFISPVTRDDTEYKLSVPQIRAFLSPELQERADTIRTLRTQHAAASERAKTMSDMRADSKSIESVVKEAVNALNAYKAIYADIDTELGVLWYRLQNDSPEWIAAWCKRYGYYSVAEMHHDLIHDLRKHYQKMQSPEFDLRCRTLIEQESPEYIEQQQQEAAKKKEVQDILRYLKRKDKAQKAETARAKFKRLEQLLGKKEAADYRPLLRKIEDDHKK